MVSGAAFSSAGSAHAVQGEQLRTHNGVFGSGRHAPWRGDRAGHVKPKPGLDTSHGHMRPITNTPLARDGKMLILAYDHGLEHGPVDFEPVPESADPEHVFELATHPAVQASRYRKALQRRSIPSTVGR
ncbi:MAG: hypothetical protein J07HX5_00834 [halophilic archaeon J07HX5]|jgi:fructose-bisphosphate aldolase (EC 4.1.2.13)|nr:MAG: hypothetical protein J07HX5_00834 [halophilic archaeon J07HX5]